jgi:hypothetical protein
MLGIAPVWSLACKSGLGPRLCRLCGGLESHVRGDGEVVPVWIGALDEGYLLLPCPALELLLSGDCVVDFVEGFVVDELADVVALGESGNLALLVLLDAAHEAVGDPNVERP